ncbi:kinase-like protein, partial [Teratosphaeria nubilosa]
KGKYIDSGVSGIVELLPNGHVIKSPWPGWPEDECKEDIAQEVRTYRRLLQCYGPRKRFIRLISYDEKEHAITMEHIVNGTLWTYLEVHNNQVIQQQRHLWIQAIVEGMEMLHAANIIHCDFSPRNMLIDHTLELKVADFGCVSIDGSRSSVGGSSRFYPTRNCEIFEVNDDLFALGSSVFEVLTWKPPYVDLETGAVRNLHGLQQFPDLVGLDFSDIIRDCWLFQAGSAREVYQWVKRL